MKTNNRVKSIGLLMVLLFIASFQQGVAQSNHNIQLKIKPSETDSLIQNTDVPHFIMYNDSLPQGKILLFLPGTCLLYTSPSPRDRG